MEIIGKSCSLVPLHLAQPAFNEPHFLPDGQCQCSGVQEDKTERRRRAHSGLWPWWWCLWDIMAVLIRYSSSVFLHIIPWKVMLSSPADDLSRSPMTTTRLGWIWWGTRRRFRIYKWNCPSRCIECDKIEPVRDFAFELHLHCTALAGLCLSLCPELLHAGEEVKEEHLLNSESFPSYLLHSSSSNPTSMIFELGGCIDSHIDTSEWQRGVFAFTQHLSSRTDLCSGHGHP